MNHTYITIGISVALSSVISVSLVYAGLAAGVFPAPQHERLVQALSQVAVTDGVALDRQLLDSDELRAVSAEYRELSEQYQQVRTEITRRIEANEVVPPELYDHENRLGSELQVMGRSLLQE